MATAIPLKAAHHGIKKSVFHLNARLLSAEIFTLLGFNTEADCIMRGNELVLRPVKENSGEFAEQVRRSDQTGI